MELRVLLEKYLNDQMTVEELRQLEELIGHDHYTKEIEDFIEDNLKTYCYREKAEFDKVAMVNAIVDGLKKEKPGIKTNYFSFLRYAALLLLIAGGYLWYITVKNNDTRTVIHNAYAPADTLRRGNLAFLTLADGKVICLDSAANGSLAKQGDARILKLDAGKISYHLADLSDTGNALVYNTINTPRGGQYQVVLPDGTKVWLNAASSLRFPVVFNRNERRVQITGEIYFEVAEDKDKPFTVSARDMNVEVLGTSFNINAYEDEAALKTTLMEGIVKVTKGNFNTMLRPGQQAYIAAKGNSVQTANTAQEIAWKNGYFEFNDASIESIMRQLARWYNLDVTYNGQINKRFLATIPRTAPIEQVFRVLEFTDAVHFQHRGNKVIVTP